MCSHLIILHLCAHYLRQNNNKKKLIAPRSNARKTNNFAKCSSSLPEVRLHRMYVMA